MSVWWCCPPCRRRQSQWLKVYCYLKVGILIVILLGSNSRNSTHYYYYWIIGLQRACHPAQSHLECWLLLIELLRYVSLRMRFPRWGIDWFGWSVRVSTMNYDACLIWPAAGGFFYDFWSVPRTLALFLLTSESVFSPENCPKNPPAAGQKYPEFCSPPSYWPPSYGNQNRWQTRGDMQIAYRKACALTE